MMKKIFSLSIALLICGISWSQKIKVKESRENIGGGAHNALTVQLFEISAADATEAFKTFMKKYDGKRSSSNNAVFIDNAIIKEIGNNTIDIYAKAIGKDGDKEISFIVAFDLGGAFLNSADHKQAFEIAEKIVNDFAIKSTTDVIEKQLKDNQKVLSKLENEQKSLEKNNTDLTDDIAEYKEKLKQAEEDLEKNKTDQTKKKAEIETQKKVVDEIDKKLKSIN